jgi:hypothetical protein
LEMGRVKRSVYEFMLEICGAMRSVLARGGKEKTGGVCAVRARRRVDVHMRWVLRDKITLVHGGWIRGLGLASMGWLAPNPSEMRGHHPPPLPREVHGSGLLGC